MADADPYDLAVIGAGIQGAGVAQAAAAAGLRVLILERSEPAAGTSSRSTKLIHGGLRYLETGQIRLVREALREQRLLLANAPGLVHRLRLRIPVYRHGTRRPGTLYAGLLLYRLLGSEMGFRRIDPRRWDNPDGLDTRDLRAVFEFYEAQTDDAALTRAVLGSALDLGAKLECPAEVTGIARLPDGWELAYGRDGQARTCRAAALVNAAGPWVNRVLGLISPAVPGLDLDLVQGAHLILAGALHGGGYYCESPEDRRAVFVLPWKADSTLVGTTETPFGGDPDQVHPRPGEIAYLQETVARHFPGRSIEVQSAFGGLRVLPRGPGGPSGRPRDSLIAVESARPPRMVTLCGGKLTTYRATAARVLARLRPGLPDTDRSGDTRQIRIGPPQDPHPPPTPPGGMKRASTWSGGSASIPDPVIRGAMCCKDPVTRSGKRNTRSIAIRSRRSRAGVDAVLPGAGGLKNLGSVGHLDDHLGTPTGEGVLAGLPGVDPLLQGMGG